MNLHPTHHALHRRERLLLPLILCAAFMLRAADALWHNNLPDQGFSFEMARLGWAEMIQKTAVDVHPPLYYALLKSWFYLTPDTMYWAMVLSALIATVTLWVLFRFTRSMFGPAAGWIALVCAAFAPYQIYWNHCARNHQLQPLAILLVIFASYHYLSRGGARLWWALAAAWLLAIQTNYMGLVFGAVWGMAFLLTEQAPLRRKATMALATLPGLVSFIPWLLVLLEDMGSETMNKGFFQETVSPLYLYYHSLFGVMVNYQPPQSGLIFMALLLFFTLVCVFGARAVGRRWSYWILLIGVPMLPIVIATGAGWTLAERHLAFSLPPFMAFWGAACVSIWSQWRERRTAKTTDENCTQAPESIE